MSEKADYEYSKKHGFILEAKERPTVTIHGSHGQPTPFDYSVMNKDGTGDCYFWTTAAPTVEGWYWVRLHYAKPSTIAYVSKTEEGEFYASIHGVLYDMRNTNPWLGPLPIPEPPPKGE